MIDSSTDGYIHVWNFYTAERLNIIEVNSFLDPFCFYLWDDDYLIVGNNNYHIELINIEGEKKTRKLFSHNSILADIIKNNHPKYGICLIWKDVQGKIFI